MKRMAEGKVILQFVSFWVLFNLISFLLCLIYQVRMEMFWIEALFSLIILLFYLWRFQVQRKKAIRNLSGHDYDPDLSDPLYAPFFEQLEKQESQISHMVMEHRARTEELQNYFSLWAHQSKLPLAAMELLLAQPDVNLMEVQVQERKLRQYVDMAMTGVRLNSNVTDYSFERIRLSEIIQPLIRSFRQEFITRKIHLEYAATEDRVLSDRKWLSLMVEQLLSNALKYTPKDGQIAITFENECLVIEDSGPGIPKEDLPRILESGFTGRNGHQKASSSSGIGLFICSSIARNLKLPLRFSRSRWDGCKVEIDFHENKRLEDEPGDTLPAPSKSADKKTETTG